MEILPYIIASLISTVLNIVCFIIGVKTAQKVNRDEEIKLPTINPIEIVKEHREKKEAE